MSDRVVGDPAMSHEPRGKDCSERRGRYDSGWTGTEQRLREQCLKQFCKLEGSTNTEAYKSSSVWCDCGKGLKADGLETCGRCPPRWWVPLTVMQ